MNNPILAVVSILIVLFCVCNANSAEYKPQWILYGSTENFDSYYDKNSLARHPDGPIIVVVRFVYTDKYAIQSAKNIKINTPIKYQHQLQAFDCNMRAYRNIKTIYYGPDYSQIYEDKSDARFISVNKGSIGESLINTLCQNLQNIPQLPPSNQKSTQKSPEKKAPTQQKGEQITNKYN